MEGTAIATTSGTAHDFTGIPSWAKWITVMLSQVSTTGTSSIILQLGDSGRFETSGYTGGVVAMSQTPSIGVTANSVGFLLVAVVAATSVDACITLSRIDSATNKWMTGGTAYRDETADIGGLVSGSKALTAALDRVRITTLGGTDTFDAGLVNILYE